MPLPGTKKGSSVGRVRMAYSFPQSTLVNYYVGGAGVGAVSTANRRALRRRAEWRPTEDGKGSKKCLGHCQPNKYANNKEFIMQSEGTALAVYPTQSSSRVLVSTYLKGSPLPTSVMSVSGIAIPATPYPAPAATVNLSASSFTEVASFTSAPNTIFLTFTLTQAVSSGITSILLGSSAVYTLDNASNLALGTTGLISGINGVTVPNPTIDYGNTVTITDMTQPNDGIAIWITNPPEGDIYLTFFGKL